MSITGRETPGTVATRSTPKPLSETPPDAPYESELDELLAIRERLSLVLATLSEEDLAIYTQEARDFLDLVVPQESADPEPTPPSSVSQSAKPG